MTILSSAKYCITHQDKDGSENLYVDSFENLRRTIATTWGRIPHRVVVEGLEVKVLKQDADKGNLTETLDALFVFSPFSSAELPDHL